MPSAIQAKDLPNSLTKDINVISSMKAIQRAGFWALIVAIVALFVLVLSSLFGKINSTIITIPLSAMYLIYSSWRLNKLKGNVSIVVILIINILVGLLLIVTIVPIVMIIMSIIALAKVGAYRKWHTQVVSSQVN